VQGQLPPDNFLHPTLFPVSSSCPNTHPHTPPHHLPPPPPQLPSLTRSAPSGLPASVKVGTHVTIEPNCVLRSCIIGNFCKVRGGHRPPGGGGVLCVWGWGGGDVGFAWGLTTETETPVFISPVAAVQPGTEIVEGVIAAAAPQTTCTYNHAQTDFRPVRLM